MRETDNGDDISDDVWLKALVACQLSQNHGERMASDAKRRKWRCRHAAVAWRRNNQAVYNMAYNNEVSAGVTKVHIAWYIWRGYHEESNNERHFNRRQTITLMC